MNTPGIPLLYLVFQTYGFEHIYQTLTPLEKVGLLKLHAYRSFPTISKDLHLLDENVDEKVCVDISAGNMACISATNIENMKVSDFEC